MYVIRFYNDAADAYRFFQRHKVSPYRYNITSTTDWTEATTFDDLEHAQYTADVMRDEMRCEVNVLDYNEHELFKMILAGK